MELQHSYISAHCILQHIVNSKDSYLLFIVRNRYLAGFEIIDPFQQSGNCSDPLPDTVALVHQIMENSPLLAEVFIKQQKGCSSLNCILRSILIGTQQVVVIVCRYIKRP